VSHITVNRWENNQSAPSGLALQKILREEQSLGLADPVPETGHLFVPGSADTSPDLDFTSEPTAIRAVVEGERVSFGHVFNPAFATETSLIDPLPHQRIAVYLNMLPQPRLRFLLADDAGAGKTIMAGLYIREMLSRRLLKRIFIVPPAGLVGNWERELRSLFNLEFKVVTGIDSRAANPFAGSSSDRVIVSIDTLAGERMFARLQEKGVNPYDLVIFDEAHKLSAAREPDFRVRKTDRYRLAETLVGVHSEDPRWVLDWNCHHVLLLTATPHMGKDFPYYALWRLLEPDALSTTDAFNALSREARQQYFLRRTKEEMVRFDGSPIYPTRISNTFSYELVQGDISEQRLYDETTSYIRTYYNRARILNRSAARLAMSVFQRRLASSTYALLRSLERRLERLNDLRLRLQTGQLTLEEIAAIQLRLGKVPDVLDEMTADEEVTEDGREENEVAEDKALGGIVGVSLAEIETERAQVTALLELARAVYDHGQESKFEKLQEVLRDPRFKDEKLIIFTEHRDTLDYLVRRLEGLGLTGTLAQIHGGMDFRDREKQIEFFRKPAGAGGARYLIATDAAGEGINLQFCWLMVNYDIPWNPARLEQRMGRIHRYKQKHDPVIIFNLVAARTREGRVLKTLLDKLEAIRRELNSDKVFDVVGRLFEGVSLKEFLIQAVTEDADSIAERLEGTLTKEQIRAIEEQEKKIYGEGGDVERLLPSLREEIEHEQFRRLLPGYIRRFIEEAAPLVGIGIEGDMEETFSVRPMKPGAMDPLWPVLEQYPANRTTQLTLFRPENGNHAIWLHPGEPFFERFREHVCSTLRQNALKGGVFIDPTADGAYLVHVGQITIVRKPDPEGRFFREKETLESRLVALKQREGGEFEECPVEYLLLLKGGEGVPVGLRRFAMSGNSSRELALAEMERIAGSLQEQHRSRIQESLPGRESFIRRGVSYQDAELAAARAKYSEKARGGDPKAKGELTRIKDRQRVLAMRGDDALNAVRLEPDLVAVDGIAFVGHALVVPSVDPEDKKRHDEAVEALAVKLAWSYEEGLGSHVKDVSTPALARVAGLTDSPGFDLLSFRPGPKELAIEVKGRAGIGDVQITDNEWAKACNLRDRYWLYVAYNCGGSQPRLLRIQDPFGKLLVRARGGVLVSEQEIFKAAVNEVIQ
jgi:superfamily II DNA or RNA helicase